MAGRHSTMLGYCDEVDLENFLLIDIDAAFSAQIEDWICVAERVVNRYCGYGYSAQGMLAESIVGEVTRSYIDSSADLVIFPRKLPINSVSQLQLTRGTTVLTLSLLSGTTPRYNIPATKDMLIYPSQELSLTGISTISNFSQLRGVRFFSKLDYNGGYTTIPDEIRMATVNLVSDMIMRHSNKEGLASITQGRVSQRWSERKGGESDFVMDAYKLMDSYRIPSNWIV